MVQIFLKLMEIHISLQKKKKKWTQFKGEKKLFMAFYGDVTTTSVRMKRKTRSSEENMTTITIQINQNNKIRKKR